MPVAPHSRVTFSGIFGSLTAPVEIWSCNINYEPQINATVANLAPVVAAARAAWATHMQPMYKPEVILTKTRVAMIGTDRLVQRNEDGGYIQADDLTTVAGNSTTTSTTRFPLQTAIAVSLNSARAGSTGKGRFFLPWMQGLLLESDYRLSQASSDSVRNAARGLVNAVGAGFGSSPATRALVVSSKGYVSAVTQIAVGRTPDTMRSRRSGLVEQRVYTAL